MLLIDIMFYSLGTIISIFGIASMVFMCRIRKKIWKEIESQDHNIEHPNCIMPEMPYCPCCPHGIISYPEETYPGEEGIFTDWNCALDNPGTQ